MEIIKHYEYKVFSAHENYVNERMKESLAEGWVEAGAASVHYHGSPTNAAFIYIPMKREIVNDGYAKREIVISGNYLEVFIKKQRSGGN